jgi:hypothetical protein
MSESVRERILTALSGCDGRVTTADVVRTTGEPLAVVQQELNWLAAHARGTLEVSATGTIVYAFPANVRQCLITNDAVARMSWLARKIWRTAALAWRISFGVNLILSLIVSAIVVFILLIRVMEGGGDFNFGGGGGGGGGGGRRKDKLPALRDKERSQELRSRPASASVPGRIARLDQQNGGVPEFFRQCFSWLFGQPDPNADLVERQWRRIAELIDENHGVLTLPQVVPFLVAGPRAGEDAMLPVLVRFNGSPEVNEQGEIFYLFPSLTQSAIAEPENVSAPVPEKQIDRQWLERFKWDYGDCGWVPGLVWTNLVLCSIVLVAAMICHQLNPVCLFGALGLFLNAIAFFVLRTFTSMRMGAANSRSMRDNLRRIQLHQLLGEPQMRARLEHAREFHVQRLLVDKGEKIIYETGHDLLEQDIERLPKLS